MSQGKVRAVLGMIASDDGRERASGALGRQLLGRRHSARPWSVWRRLASMRLAVVVLVGASLFMFMPAAVQAGTSPATVFLGSKVFPSGAAVPGGLSGTIPVARGSSVTLTTPQYLYEPATPPATPAVYQFMFWDVNATLIKTVKAKFTAPAAGGVIATAWYLPICVTSPCGTGPTAVTTFAFSLTTYRVLSGAPIDAVTPASAWTSPSTSVSTATAVAITASPYFGPSTASSGKAFVSWFVFGGASTVTISGPDLTVPAGESPYAIAFYRQYTHPIYLNPCPGPECPPPPA